MIPSVLLVAFVAGAVTGLSGRPAGWGVGALIAVSALFALLADRSWPGILASFGLGLANAAVGFALGCGVHRIVAAVGHVRRRC